MVHCFAPSRTSSRPSRTRGRLRATLRAESDIASVAGHGIEFAMMLLLGALTLALSALRLR